MKALLDLGSANITNLPMAHHNTSREPTSSSIQIDPAEALECLRIEEAAKCGLLGRPQTHWIWPLGWPSGTSKFRVFDRVKTNQLPVTTERTTDASIGNPFSCSSTGSGNGTPRPQVARKSAVVRTTPPDSMICPSRKRRCVKAITCPNKKRIAGFSLIRIIKTEERTKAFKSTLSFSSTTSVIVPPSIVFSVIPSSIPSVKISTPLPSALAVVAAPSVALVPDVAPLVALAIKATVTSTVTWRRVATTIHVMKSRAIVGCTLPCMRWWRWGSFSIIAVAPISWWIVRRRITSWIASRGVDSHTLPVEGSSHHCLHSQVGHQNPQAPLHMACHLAPLCLADGIFGCGFKIYAGCPKKSKTVSFMFQDKSSNCGFLLVSKSRHRFDPCSPKSTKY